MLVAARLGTPDESTALVRYVPALSGRTATVSDPATASPMEAEFCQVAPVMALEWRKAILPPTRTSRSGLWSQRRIANPPMALMVRFCGAAGGASRPRSSCLLVIVELATPT
jgi:hypothetical protein